jgi:photosystem II stability/assembly factor-like uncharacterized protein
MKKIIPFLFCSLAYFVGIAQKKDAGAVTEKKFTYDSVLYENLKYRSIGPYRGGRSAAVAGDLKRKNVFYFGGTGGGVWKTQDGGSNWKNISDKFFGGSIGSISIAPNDAQLIYVGTGENTFRGNVSEGNGMWKSEDGGRSWKNIGLKDSRHITRIVIHPKNPDIVWTACSGHLFGPSQERGVYKTTDGGKTWRRVLFSNEQAGAIDLIADPGNPNILYASTWRVIRTPYSMESGGAGSALWKSTDGGETWKNISKNKGLPKDTIGIIGITVSPANPDRLYAIIESRTGGVFTSNDAGETWTKTSDNSDVRQRSWYFSKIFCDTKNENTIYICNVGFYRSRDGGKTFTQIQTPHGDHHDFWIDPEDSQRMIVADDGGGQISFDAGANWSTYHNQATAQFYRVSTDNHFPYRILGAQQDNSTVRIMSRTYGGAINEDDWSSTAGFESGHVVADPLNPDVVYGGNYGGYLSRLDHKTGENRTISVWPDSPIGSGADGLKYRFQWNFPIFFSPHNPKRIYAGGNMLFKSDNEGTSWETISPDLTTNDKSKQVASGGIITKDNTTVEYYCTIFAATESPLEKDLLWVGSDDGLVHVSKNGGQSWENVSPKGMPEWMMWNCIEVDPFKKGSAYFVGTRYKLDDYTPYIYKTEDYGKTWKKITTGILPLHFTRALRADKQRAGLLYCGTEFGMYVSFDDGQNWKTLQQNLPFVPITDLAIKDNDLIVATQGRSFWVLDDLSALQQMNTGLTAKPIFAFNPRPVYRCEGFVNPNATNAGSNPPNGLVLDYFLRDFSDTSQLKIVLYDKNNKHIRSYSTSAEKDEKLEAKKGMNRFVWNLFYPVAEKIEDMVLWSGSVGGPKAAPGNYRAVVKTRTDSVSVNFTVVADPNYKISQSDYDVQFNFLIQIRDKFSETQKGIKQIRELRQQLNALNTRMAKDSTAKEIKTSSDSIQKRITRIEEALYQTKAKSGQDVLNYPIRLNDKLSSLYDAANSGYMAPSKQVVEVYGVLSEQIDKHLLNLKSIKEVDVKNFNALLKQKEVPVIFVK